jgi:hypothetical protein
MNEQPDYMQPVLDRFDEGWPKEVHCDEGWHLIIVATDEAMARIDPGYRVHQIKEKFGGLRYYFRASDESLLNRLNEIVRGAEFLCSLTCEVTGQKGQLMRRGGNTKTLCHEFIKEGWQPA